MILFLIYLNLEEFGSYFSATDGVFMYVYRQAGGLGWIWIYCEEVRYSGFLAIDPSFVLIA